MFKALFVTMCLAAAQIAYADEPLPQSIYEITVTSLTGQAIPLSAFRGRAIFIVNTASQDRNSTQISKLEDLYQKFSENGLVVLAFPSNDFMNEEPGPNADVLAAYQSKFHLTFPVIEKTHVTGSNISPLFAFLTNSKTDPSFGWEIDWNFTKFLVDRSGNIVARFNTTTDPMDPKVIQAVEKALAQ